MNHANGHCMLFSSDAADSEWFFFSWFILLTAVKRGILRNGNEQTNEQKMCVSGHIAQERVLNACWPKQNIITE